MRSKDTLVLEKLYSKVLMEKFYSYDPPQDKKTLMYDFYVINYLQYILGFKSQGFRELPDDIVDSVKDAANKLYPYLKKELLDAVFYAICAEFRHFSDYSENYKRLENMYGDNENIKKFLNLYDRYGKFYKKGSKDQEELVKTFGVEKPSAKERPPEIEKKEGSQDRVTSYKAANYALEQTGMSRAFFVSLARDCYIKLIWSASYGGDAWCGICKGWLLLDAAEKMDAATVVSSKAPEAEVKGKGEEPDFYKQKSQRTKKEPSTESRQLDIPSAIDHIYDLQHNTDTVFNKLRSYYKGGYGWIEQALTDKANVKSYYELLKKTSGTLRSIAPRVLYNKLGQTWESYAKDKTPDSNSGIPKIKSRETKCGDIPKYQETRPSSPSNQDNIPIKPDNGSSKFPSGNFDKQALNAVFLMPEDDVYNIGKKYYVGKSTTDNLIAFVVGFYDDSTQSNIQIGDPFQVSENAFVKLDSTQQNVINFVNKTISDHKEKSTTNRSAKGKDDVYLTADDLMFALDVLGSRTPYQLKDKYTISWEKYPNDPAYTNIYVIDPQGQTINKIKEKDPKSQTKELTKMINNFIKVNVAKGFTKKQSQSSASGILSQGIYVTGNDIKELLKLPQHKYMELKDGYHLSHWQSSAAPSQKGFVQFRVWKETEDNDYKLIYNMTGHEFEDGTLKYNNIASNINEAIKEDKKPKKEDVPLTNYSGDPDDYVNGNDIKKLLKNIDQNEKINLTDGYYISHWQSSAVPSQKGLIQFRIWKEDGYDDYKLISTKEQKIEDNNDYNQVASAINKIIKIHKSRQKNEDEEDEYSTEDEIDIEDGYINVKALKFTFYSGGVVLGDGYTASVGPKINGPSMTPDPFKILEIKKGKNVIFSDRLYEGHVEDNFQKLKSMAETINNKIKEDLKGTSLYKGDTTDWVPPKKKNNLDESFKKFFFRTIG